MAVRSGQKCGKSIVAAIAALWFVCCFANARVVVTAPTGRQVREILWQEITRLYTQAAIPIGGKLARTPSGGLRFEDGRQLIGFSTDRPVNMAGVSGATMMYIVDEASGYSDAIFDAIEGNLGGSSQGRLVMFSNPTDVAGFFYDAFHRKASFWKRFVISSEEAAKYADRFPGLMRPEEIAEKEADRGRDSVWFRVRILGEFPSSAADTIVSLAQVDAAHERFREMLSQRARVHLGDDAPKTLNAHELASRLFGPEDGPLELGVDVARFGDDDSVIVPRRGKVVFPYVTVSGYDSQEVAGAVAHIVRALRVGNEKATVKVDGIGYGAGTVDALRRDEFTELVDVVDVNVSRKSDDEEAFPNLRSQLWFGVADFIKDGGTLPVMTGPEDGRLEAELLTPKYKIDPQGRRVVEAKAETKKRLNRSPDRADGLALAVYRRARPNRPDRGGGRRRAQTGGYRFEGDARGY